MKPPTGASSEYLNFSSRPFDASNIPPKYTSKDAIHEITKSTKDESELKIIVEYARIGNGMNNKNKTPKNLPQQFLHFEDRVVS